MRLHDVGSVDAEKSVVSLSQSEVMRKVPTPGLAR